MSPKKAFLAVLALGLLTALGARAEEPSALREGAFQPVIVQAVKDGVVVRTEPGFLFKELRTLERAEQVTVNRRQGAWLRLQTGGWVAVEDVADASRPLPSDDGPPRLRVKTDGVRLRSGPGTEHGIAGGRSAGDVLEAKERVGDWWRLDNGLWIHASLVEELAGSSAAPDAAGSLSAPVSTGAPVRRWSYMDLNGTLFEIFEVDKKAPFLHGLKQAMRDTGVLEHDWTYLRLVITVQQGQLSFRYSPRQDGNPVSVVDSAGKRFGSVFVQGPVERIPIHLRGFFEGQVIQGGERYEGLLMFRPTLDPQEIEKVQMLISGRPRTFFESQ